MGKTVSKTFDDLMPASFDKEDKLYKALVGDSDTDSGALTNEIKDVTQFVNYYTRTQRVDEAETVLLEFITSIFSGITRHYSEPDEYLRLRYKALVERKRTTLWNGRKSIESVFSYFFKEKNIYIVERYPVNTLVVNGDFDTMAAWNYNTVDTEFRMIYSRSFEGGSAMYINPSKVNPAGYMEQSIAAVPTGLYEFVFFFSSPKKGRGDVQYSIRDGAGKYWNGSAWVTGEYFFREEAEDDTAGYYVPVQNTVSIPATTNITIRFKNKNGNGVLIDSVRFGKISEPTFRVYITAEPELFFDGSIRADKKYNFSGFRQYYIETDMAEILRLVKPAGVYAEMTMLSSRLNIPWDRILIEWETTIRTNWHILFDGSRNFNNGVISYVNLYFDGSVSGDEKYLFDGKKMIRSIKPTDLLAGEPLYRNVVKYKKGARIQLTRQLYFDGKVGADGRFNFSGEVIGMRVGYSMVKVTRNVTIQKTGQAIFDGQWKANEELKFDGEYKYYQSGIETFILGG